MNNPSPNIVTTSIEIGNNIAGFTLVGGSFESGAIYWNRNPRLNYPSTFNFTSYNNLNVEYLITDGYDNPYFNAWISDDASGDIVANASVSLVENTVRTISINIANLNKSFKFRLTLAAYMTTSPNLVRVSEGQIYRIWLS